MRNALKRKLKSYEITMDKQRRRRKDWKNAKKSRPRERKER